MSAKTRESLAILRQEGKSNVELVTEFSKTYDDDELLQDLSDVELFRDAPDGYYNLWQPILHSEAMIRGLVRE